MSQLAESMRLAVEHPQMPVAFVLSYRDAEALVRELGIPKPRGEWRVGPVPVVVNGEVQKSYFLRESGHGPTVHFL